MGTISSLSIGCSVINQQFSSTSILGNPRSIRYPDPLDVSHYKSTNICGPYWPIPSYDQPHMGSINMWVPQKWMVYKGKSQSILLKWMRTRGTPMTCRKPPRWKCPAISWVKQCHVYPPPVITIDLCGIVVYIDINHSQSWLVTWHCLSRFSHINCRWNMNHGWNQAASLYFAPAMGQIRKWWYGTTKKPSGYKPPRLQEDFSDGDGSANTHRGSGIPTRPNKQDRNCFQITLW